MTAHEVEHHIKAAIGRILERRDVIAATQGHHFIGKASRLQPPQCFSGPGSTDHFACTQTARQLQGDLAERAGGAQDQHLLTLLNRGFFQGHDGAGRSDAHADRGFIVHVVRHIPYFGLRHQGALCPGTKRQHRALAEIHPAAIRRTANAFSANDTGIFNTQTVGAEYIPATKASGIDIDQHRAV